MLKQEVGVHKGNTDKLTEELVRKAKEKLVFTNLKP